MKELLLNVENAANFKVTFSNFVKKFSVMDKSILIKLVDNKFTATMSNFEKSVIKYAESEINDVTFSENVTEAIFLPFMSYEKVIKILEFFGNDSLDLKITYDTVDGNLVGLNICFRNENLTMELGCAKISLFETSLKVTKDILAQLSDTSNPLYSIEATEEMINKIKNLSATNMDDEIYIEAKENAAYLIGT
jgi:hypothetical protein